MKYLSKNKKFCFTLEWKVCKVYIKTRNCYKGFIFWQFHFNPIWICIFGYVPSEAEMIRPLFMWYRTNWDNDYSPIDKNRTVIRCMFR